MERAEGGVFHRGVSNRVAADWRSRFVRIYREGSRSVLLRDACVSLAKVEAALPGRGARLGYKCGPSHSPFEGGEIALGSASGSGLTGPFLAGNDLEAV